MYESMTYIDKLESKVLEGLLLITLKFWTVWECEAFFCKELLNLEVIHLMPTLYYVRMFRGFFEPPTHLSKEIFTT